MYVVDFFHLITSAASLTSSVELIGALSQIRSANLVSCLPSRKFFIDDTSSVNGVKPNISLMPLDLNVKKEKILDTILRRVVQFNYSRGIVLSGVRT